MRAPRRSPLLLGVAAVAATLAFGGCKNDDEDDKGPPQPAAVTFEGTPDARFVGDWKTADARSELDLAKAGGLKIAIKIASPSGDSTSHFSGSWLVSGEDLLLKYANPPQGDVEIKYKASIKGNTMTLVQGRLKTTYRRK